MVTHAVNYQQVTARSTTLGLALLAAFRPGAQSQFAAEPRFEAASARVADRRAPFTPIAAGGEIKGGPGTDDPERITYRWAWMSMILQRAFGISYDQILDRPDWTVDTRFDIVAKLPPGATKDQANAMMQNLLKERFHLAYHFIKKDVDGFNLVIAKGGPKLKQAAPPDGPAPDATSRQIPLDQDGYPKLPAGYRNSNGLTTNGIMHVTFRKSGLAGR